MDEITFTAAQKILGDKGRLVGQKPPLQLKEIWAIQTWPEAGIYVLG